MADDTTTGPDDVGLEIEGKVYQIPDSYTLGEARVLKRLTGLNLAELALQQEEKGMGALLTDPDFLTFTVWCAMHRESPRIKVEDVEKLDLLPLLKELFGDASDAPEEAESGPPEPAAEAADAEETEHSGKSATPSEESSERGPETPPLTPSGSPG